MAVVSTDPVTQLRQTIVIAKLAMLDLMGMPHNGLAVRRIVHTHFDAIESKLHVLEQRAAALAEGE